jgi:hypothetical protein
VGARAGSLRLRGFPVHVSVSGPDRPLYLASLTVVFEAGMPSAREPGLVYRVTLHADGTWQCSCPGFRYNSRLDGLCKNIDFVSEQYELSRSLAGLLS